MKFLEFVSENNVVRSNAILGWGIRSVCLYDMNGGCLRPPADLIVDRNFEEGDPGFIDEEHFDFRLNPGSPLIDTGYPLEGLVPDDFIGTTRPQGKGYDIGAYEFITATI